jgi:hypothetical protein
MQSQKVRVRGSRDVMESKIEGHRKCTMWSFDVRTNMKARRIY